MGLQDRDYMRERREPERVFAPPEPSLRSSLMSILIWVAVALVCYKAVAWWKEERQRQRAATRTAPAPSPAVPRSDAITAPARVAGPTASPPVYRAPPHQPAPAAALPAPSQVTVNRCVVNGRTTFSDAQCGPEAAATRITVNASQNAADGLRNAPAVIQAPPRSAMAPPVAHQPAAEPVNDFAVRKATCDWLEHAIAAIDAQARQPISAAQQDYLAAERKRHRDEQFRLRC